MILGIFLTPGDSLEKQAKVGQDERFINYYLKAYSQNFEKVFIFSYGDRNYKKRLSQNVYLFPNEYKIPYLLYQFLACFLYFKEIESCSVFRVMQATGGVPAVIAKFLSGKKFVITYGFDYALFARIEGKVFRAWLIKLFLKPILFLADKIIVTSKKNYQSFKKIFPEKVFYIPNGVDVEKFKVKSSKLKVQKDETISILSVGRLVRQKNFSLLLEAAARSKYKKKIKISIIGEGPEREFLVRLASGYKINLEIIGVIPHSKIVDYFQKVDIFCLPSLAEGQSKVLLEALACRLICLASDIPANREIVKDGKNGMLFKLDSKNLAEKIDFLIKNHKRNQQLAEKGRRYVVKNHDINKLLQKEIQLFNKK